MEFSRHIDIKIFSTQSGQDIALWLKRFQRAVDAALKADATDDQKKAAYLRYLPTKLDDDALTSYENSGALDNWDNLKVELISKLSDPSKAQSFQNRLDSIRWDEESSLISYENKILASIQNYDPDIAQNETLFKRESFKRFMAGLPKNYRTFVDAGLALRDYDITKARERAEKYQDFLSRNDNSAPLATLLGFEIQGPQKPQQTHNTNPQQLGAYKNSALDTLSEQMNILSINQKESIELQKETQKCMEQISSSLKAQNQYRGPSNYGTPNYGNSGYNSGYGNSGNRNRTPPRSPFRQSSGRSPFSSPYGSRRQGQNPSFTSQGGPQPPYFGPPPNNRSYGPPQQGYPNQQQGYPNQQQGYQNRQQGYPNQQQGYPNQQQGYPNQQQGHPNQQQSFNPNQQQGFNPNQQQGYNPQAQGHTRSQGQGPQFNISPLGQNPGNSGNYSQNSQNKQNNNQTACFIPNESSTLWGHSSDPNNQQTHTKHVNFDLSENGQAPTQGHYCNEDL